MGIEACRAIQNARCEAGVPCDIIADVAACKRFSRDNCLHGLATVTSPSTDELNACTGAITTAGETLDCDVVQEPQGTVECDFLNELAPPTDTE